MLPILSVLMDSEEKIGDASDFTISLSLGFTAEEHASLAGLPLSRVSTKKLIAEYNEKQNMLLAKSEEIQPLPQIEKEPEPKKEVVEVVKEKDPGQTKLF
jgi:hypothetical protein